MDVTGKKVVVVGLGRTALALVRLLLREGARPFVTDSGDPDTLGPLCAKLETLGVPFECGGHSEDAFDGADVVIPSPGVPPGIAPIVAAREQGCDVVGEIEFAFPHCRSKLLAVSGTNGKTTTTELLRTLVAGCGYSVDLAGNNDRPLSEAVLAEPAPEFLVLEVSSYQLEMARTFRPWIGAVLNVTPDHLGRHGAMDEYAAVKARLFRNQSADDFAVLNADDPLVNGMGMHAVSQEYAFSVKGPVDRGLWANGDVIRDGDEAVATVSDIPLPGAHNLENALAALTMMRAGGFDWERTVEGLRSFRGVEHRIEFVTAIDDVRFYNDSKSTNIDSLRVALESFEEPIVLIAGGQGKGSDYGVLRELVVSRVKHLVALGEDAVLFVETFGDLVPTDRVETMEDAVRYAARAASPGDVVLLSPACASFDMFENFEHRGRAFKQAVAELSGQALTSGEKAR